VLTAVHTASGKLGGASDIPTAISIATLALKHRQNKNLRQRVLVFIGSPLAGQGADEKNMVKLAKRLKKNNVAVDVVAFGDGIEEGESNVLRQFVDAANSSDNSLVLVVGHFIS
jgi:26S proteasome regulatory subunit N10